jgi:nucleosome binding factor SPN SPT16 subunit
VWENIGVLVVTNGRPDEDIIYKKSTALQDWLVGFELENTVMVFTERGVHILTSQADLLGGIADARPADWPELSTALYPAVEAGDNTQNFERLLAITRDNLEGRGVGALPGGSRLEAALGDFIATWTKAFDDAGFTVVNAANAIGNLFSTKDEQEQVRLPCSPLAPTLFSFFIVVTHQTHLNRGACRHSCVPLAPSARLS